MNKLNASEFAAFLLTRYASGDGYIMGATGQNPQTWSKSSWWFRQYRGKQRTQALKWRASSERVWDCQGMSEGYINSQTGSKINVRARNNYSSWCNPKGKGIIPAEYRVPGAAVFKAYSSGTIHHVGYLIEPVDAADPAGDWWVIEAKGVMYGVVRTRLLADKAWNRWGWMTKYFDYSAYEPKTYELGERTLQKGLIGDDVKELQSTLIEMGYDCGKWGADGDFGSATETAVRAFQADFRLPVDGICDVDDFEAINDALLEDDPDEAPATHIVDALDLSSHNAASEPKIDWDAVKRDVAFLILRCGCTRVKTAPLGIGADVYFDKWATICRNKEIPFWAYYYSHASSEAQAREEARYLFEHASPYAPVGYVMDAEESSLTGAYIEAFFDELRTLGATRTMIYEAHHLYGKFNLPVDADGFVACADATWIPRYGKNDGTAQDKYLPKYPCDAWQYTSKYALDAIPDKTLDANIVTGQRRSLAWFRGEE